MMCEAEAQTAGNRAAKNERHPQGQVKSEFGTVVVRSRIDIMDPPKPTSADPRLQA
jgi:hypothetical protein